jgi:signal transduction histidine kinase
MVDDSAIEAIKETPIFKNLREEDLTQLVANSKRHEYGPGECLLVEGEPGNSLIVVINGEVEVVRDTGDHETSLARFGPGSFVGEMALIDHGPRTATVRARTETVTLEISRDEFDRLLNESPDACRVLLGTVLRRLKSTEAMLVNQEKMAGLGRITAGLAHELNNPASAVSRLTAQLTHDLGELQQATLALASDEQSELTTQLLEATRARSTTEPSRPMSALQRAELEDSLADALSALGISDPWDSAASLASAGWQPTDVHDLALKIPDERIGPAFNWLAMQSRIASTLSEVKMSAERLVEVVGAVKRYSHLDRAPVEQVDINSGIESTLVILRHKLRNIDVGLNLEEGLPSIEGYPAELNQVWTNLIDNAVDAMGGTGKIQISTREHDGNIVVQFTDNGSGISDEHIGRLFEPFFTTKDVGVGTGLGLHISHNIVVQHHGGNIEATSQPGQTTFTVTLPRLSRTAES